MAGWDAQFEVVAGVAFAMLLGGMIGFEREMKDRPAGFRTHMLVSGAAALLVGLGQLILADHDYHRGDNLFRFDPFRLDDTPISGQPPIRSRTLHDLRGYAESR